LCDRLIAEDSSFSRVVTATTRDPRAGEINGVDYHFLEPSVFKARVAAGDFLEWAYVHGKEGDEKRMYGTLKESVLPQLRAGRNLVIHIEVQGVAAFRSHALTDGFFAQCLHTVFIWAYAHTLAARMKERYARDHGISVDQISPEQNTEIGRRLVTAEVEIREMSKFDTHIKSSTKDEDFASLMKAVQAHRAALTRRAADIKFPDVILSTR
jgi:guanylate kinase